MKSNKRWRLIANWKLQGALILRLFVYWLIFQIAEALTTSVFSYVSSDIDPSEMFFPRLFVSLLVLPLCMFDMISFSNRFVGPIKNLGRGLRELADGAESPMVKLRDGDFYTELADDFDRIKNRLNGLPSPEQESAPVESHELETSHA